MRPSVVGARDLRKKWIICGCAKLRSGVTKMRSVDNQVIALALLLPVVGSDAQAAEPYDLRGIRLGISISEFRKLKHPDDAQAKVICSNDADAKKLRYSTELGVYGSDRDAGVLRCNHFKFGKLFDSSSLPPEWQEVNLNVATVGVYMTYKFVPDPQVQNVPMLYWIGVRSNVQYWSKFWEGYTTKYGKPHSIDNSSSQNRMGATFDNVRAVWNNNVSTIILLKRSSEIQRTDIVYTHTRLLAEVEKRERSKRGRPEDKL